MEWIETTAKSVQEAKDLALDKLGVDEAEAEFDVLEEPKAGLFGRVRGQARIRARVVPKSPRARAERNDRRRTKGRKQGESGEGGDSSASAADVGDEPASGPSTKSPAAVPSRKRTPKPTEESTVEQVQASVEGFLRGLTSAFGIETTVSSEINDDALDAQIEGKHGLLLGPKGRTLEAIQELTRVSAQRGAPSSTRIRVDIGGYREARRAALAAFAAAAAQRAIDEGVEIVLEPMNAADRKIVHDSLGDTEGVTTRSAGNEPRRRVVVVPDRGGDADGDGHDGDDDQNDD
ncbi:MAG: Jag N-terminal domain-containing protein [Actinomycetota bacterium]|nr:Jag N-terminal domain-containing protein [Actinomycetota bacterium]